MEWVQISAPTEEEALDQALDVLGVPRDEAEWEVLEESRARLGGILGRTETRIRARIKPKSREKPQPKRRGRERSGRGGDRPGGRKRGSAKRSEDKGGQRRRGDGGGERVNAEHEDDEIEVPLDEQATMVEEFARGLTDAFGALDAEIRVEPDGENERINVAIEGEELGLLVGPGAVTVDAIEELTRTVLQRRTGGNAARVRVDVDGYRERRRAALEEFAQELAERARSTGREQALEPMGASDRKLVHDAVAELEDVVTVSEGEEPRRRVVIRRA
jgi:spoIIIJ-associated protein